MPQNDSFQSSEISQLQFSLKLLAQSRVQAQADLVLYLAEDLASLISCEITPSGKLDLEDNHVIPSLQSLNTALMGLNEFFNELLDDCI